MKERFKRYLEQQFRAIRPTMAAMEYREKMLRKLMDRAQELRIKGMDDEDLIYDMCIDELGDFGATLAAFDEEEHKVANAKRNAVLGAVCGVGAALALVVVYLIVSFLVPGSWGLTWLILVGGAFAGGHRGRGGAASQIRQKQEIYPDAPDARRGDSAPMRLSLPAAATRCQG